MPERNVRKYFSSNHLPVEDNKQKSAEVPGKKGAKRCYFVFGKTHLSFGILYLTDLDKSFFAYVELKCSRHLKYISHSMFQFFFMCLGF